MTWKILTSASWRLVVALLGTLAFLADSGRAAVTTSRAEERFVELLNGARQQAGKPALTRDPALDQLARDWSAQMARNTFAHRPDLAEQIARIEPQHRTWAENISWRGAAGGVADADLIAVHDGLMASPGHRANITGDFNRLGVGVHIDGDTLWVTFDFLNGPAIVAPSPPALPATPATAAPAPAPASPVGWFRMTRIDRERVRVAGWALDPNTANPVRIRVRVGSTARLQLASRPHLDVARVYPALGSRHGFAVVVPARRGARICVDAIEAGGVAHALGCRRVRG